LFAATPYQRHRPTMWPMMGGNDVESTDEITRQIARWRAGVSEQAQRFDATRRAIDEVSVIESAAGGAIVLTVGSSGIPTDLQLGEDVGRMKPEQIATQLMACLRRAQARLAERVGTVVADAMGDAPGAEAVVEEYRYRFPPPSDEDATPLAPLEENADFGLSELDTEPPPSPATPIQDQPAAPTRTKPQAPTRNEDEDWESSPW
jgi:hypothetical protein